LTDTTFRRLTPVDTDVLAESFARNDVEAVTRTFDPFPLGRATAEALLDPKRLDWFFGAFERDAIVAFSMLRGRDEGYEVPSFGIFVDKDEQGRGLGSKLTEWTVEQARNAGMPAVRLSVYASNPGALRMYERLGFEVQSREPVERAGEADVRIVMLRRFQTPR
jgi:ribosomal protein S18 acetylase RimI-like enzyme